MTDWLYWFDSLEESTEKQTWKKSINAHRRYHGKNEYTDRETDRGRAKQVDLVVIKTKTT